MAERPRDLKDIARSYSELRLQAIGMLRRINEYSTILFRAFVEYAGERRGENLEPRALLNEFFNALALDREKDRGARVSLARRFYKLAEKHARKPGKQASILQYLEY